MALSGADEAIGEHKRLLLTARDGAFNLRLDADSLYPGEQSLHWKPTRLPQMRVTNGRRQLLVSDVC